MRTVKFTLLLLLNLLAQCAIAQLDTIHWIPPMHARSDWGPQYLYLSTPEQVAFPVNIRDGAGNLLQTVEISNSQPYRYNIGSTNTTPVLVTEAMLHQPLQGKGLVMDGPKKFYAYLRAHSNSQYQAGDLTCKGTAALGTIFRIGHLFQSVTESDEHSNFIGVMATEDSTLVTLSDFDPNTDFRINSMDTPVSGPQNVLLQKGESVVFSNYMNLNGTAQPPNGLIGALLSATKPVAVNTGSWLGSVVTDRFRDIGIDQIAPLEKVGKEYILCKGNGSSDLERPMVVAHFDNTKVWLNGNTNPVTTLQAGDFIALQTASFSAAGNLYVRTSEPVFIYQMIGGTPTGDDALRTQGLIFVPPISCATPNAVDNIYQPNRIGSMAFEGGLMIVAMRDSAVTVRIDGNPVALGAPDAVLGNPEFVTYRNLKLFTQTSTISTISVQAEGAVQVAMYGRNNPASFAAFFSGFSKTIEPTVELTLIGDGVCPDTLSASGLFDGVQWVYEDSIIQYGPDTFLVAYAPGKYEAVGYLGVCRQTDFAVDTATVAFVSPAFPYSVAPPSCFGFKDGEIAIGTPYGGIPPYQYSIDNGQSFSTDPLFANIGATDYKLVVRDSTGCYNRPLALIVTQPDSLSLALAIVRANDPLKSGNEVVLEAAPNRPIISATWSPQDSSGCTDCLTYTFYPALTTEVGITVFDSMGCPATAKILVIVQPNVFAPNVLNPESPEGNDRFTLFSREPLPILQLSIYDRWGEQLFAQENLMTNDVAMGWDGYFRGKRVLPGVYVYVAEVEIVPGTMVMVKGSLMVI